MRILYYIYMYMSILPRLLACWMVFFLLPQGLTNPLMSKTLICTDALVYVPEEIGPRFLSLGGKWKPQDQQTAGRSVGKSWQINRS